MENKSKIIQIFNDNVKGKRFDPSGYTIGHDGKEGHWLEHNMGIAPNADNQADILGYEMKKQTPSKTTFGDWSAKYSIFNRAGVNGNKISRDRFLEIFGKPNPLKDNRLSWSGEPVPKINQWNGFGQKLIVDEQHNILAIYSFSQDQRPNKSIVVPNEFQIENLVLTCWPYDDMKKKVENEFNQSGWFKCFKDGNGIYNKIGFAPVFDFNQWIERVKTGVVFFDSGMYQGNNRAYSQWRANNKYWDSLITEYY